MKVYIVANDCAFIVGVYDTEAQARSAHMLAIMDGVVDPWIQAVELNTVNTGTTGVEEIK